MPREFASVAMELGTNSRWHTFSMPGYRGNLVADFNPVSTANEIDRLLPKLQSDPFARLLVSTYGDATAEADYGFALLRFWSVLELIADRQFAKGVKLSHPNGLPNPRPKGQPETTDSKHGRVYSLILAQGAFLEHGTGGQGTYIIGGDASRPGYHPAHSSLPWEMVRAAHAIRNAIAHEGEFDVAKAASGDAFQQLATRLRMSGHPDPLRFIRNQSWLAVSRYM